MNNIEYLVELIEEGKNVRNRNIKNEGRYGEFINGLEYETWISKCTLFLSQHYNENLLFNKYLEASQNAVGNGSGYFDTMIGILQALIGASEIKTKNKKTTKKEINKIFISHSSKDSEFVEHIIDLLNKIGLPKDSKSIFCSSFEGYAVPLKEDIYQYIKTQFEDNILIIFVLSHNFYDSPACLNEMGAAWVKTTDHIAMVIPPFDFSDIKGAINPRSNMVKIDDSQKLNTFRQDIVDNFNLSSIDVSIWERDRNSFLSNIDSLVKKEIKKRNPYRVLLESIKPTCDGKIELDLRFLNTGNKPTVFYKIIILITDSNGKKIEEELDSKEFVDFTIYPNEKRRVVLTINKLYLEYDFSTFKNFVSSNAREVY